MVDLQPRLRMAWRAKAVRYNHLSKDFEDAPEWYLKYRRAVFGLAASITWLFSLLTAA
jgi:hypothetical protein